MACSQWSADLLTGGTLNASSEYATPTYQMENAFDADPDSNWVSADADVPSWIGYEMSAAEKIERVNILFGDLGLYATDYTIEATNDNDVNWDDRTWTTLLTGTDGANGANLFKEFTNATAYDAIRVRFTAGFSSGNSNVAVAKLAAFVCDDVLQNDSMSIDDYFFAGQPGKPKQLDSMSVDDAFAATKLEPTATQDSMSISDSFFATPVMFHDDSMSIDDEFTAFNQSVFFQKFQDVAVSRFFCTLTGAADGLSDAILAVSSVQARHRTGEPSYLSVVTPGIAQADNINARLNGEIVIEQAYFIDNVELYRQEIFRADFEDVTIYQGSRNRSITLTGHKTLSYVQKSVTLDKAEYEQTDNGVRRVRFPYIDPFVRPGDLVTVNASQFTVGYIALSIAIGRRTMELVEA